jgi:spore coat protein CotH
MRRNPEVSMPMRTTQPGASRRKLVVKVTSAALTAALLGACSSGGQSVGDLTASSSEAATGSAGAGSSGSGSGSGSASVRADDGSLFDNSVVHDIEVTFDQDEYDEMIGTFQSTGEKEWITGTITIDGVTLRDVGLRLKGNSSLSGLRNNNGGRAGGPGGNVSASSPNSLPWLVRLDKNVDGQSYDGYTSFVIRSNNTTSALNEAVALELIGLSGQATQLAFSTRFSVNGGAEVLRLAIENPDDVWDEEYFDTDGILYKAESGGDYSYRGDEPAAYDEIFDQESDTDNENLTPLIEFLEFINESDDATFAAQLSQHLDIDAFARYLAGQELVANQDDIDGPGNNSYLRYDSKTGLMTIVSWDLNLSFGSMGGGAARTNGAAPANGAGANANGAPTMAAPGARPGGAGGAGGAGFRGRSNILVERFLANATFAAKYQKALSDMRTELYASGTATEVLSRWTELLKAQASDLVPATTLTQESANIARYFTA